MTKRAFVLLIVLGLVIAGLNASLARSRPAAVDDIPRLQFEKYTLPNGLEVILSQDRRLPMVAVNLWYHVGPANEEPGRTGFAHLFEHMMFQPGFPIWLWYFCPSDHSSRLDCRGFRQRTRATEGDTQWVNYKPSPFSSRSTDF